MDINAHYAKEKRSRTLQIEQRVLALIEQAVEDIENTRANVEIVEDGPMSGNRFGPDVLKRLLECFEKTDKITREERNNPTFTSEDETVSGATLAEIVQSQQEEIKLKLKEMGSGKFGDS